MSPWLTAALLTLGSAPQASSRPQPRARLVYEATGPTSCPDGTAIQQEVAARLGYDPFLEPAELEFRVQISETARHLRARLSVQGRADGAQRAQELTSATRDCRELESALVLAMSIAIDPLSLTRPAPPPPAPPPPAPQTAAPMPPPSSPATVMVVAPSAPPLVVPPEPHTPTEVGIGVGGLGAVGIAPSPTLGFNLLLELRRPAFSVGAEVRATLAASENLPNGGTASLSLVAGAVSGCGRVWWANLCGLAAAGAASSSSTGLASSRQVTTPYLALGGRASLDIPLFSTFVLRPQLELDVPLIQTQILVSQQPVWSMPAVEGVASLVAVVHLS